MLAGLLVLPVAWLCRRLGVRDSNPMAMLGDTTPAPAPRAQPAHAASADAHAPGADLQRPGA